MIAEQYALSSACVALVNHQSLLRAWAYWRLSSRQRSSSAPGGGNVFGVVLAAGSKGGIDWEEMVEVWLEEAGECSAVGAMRWMRLRRWRGLIVFAKRLRLDSRGYRLWLDLRRRYEKGQQRCRASTACRVAGRDTGEARATGLAVARFFAASFVSFLAALAASLAACSACSASARRNSA